MVVDGAATGDELADRTCSSPEFVGETARATAATVTVAAVAAAVAAGDILRR